MDIGIDRDHVQGIPESGFYERSIEMFGALKRLGKECEFVTYPDAEHWYGAWSNDQLRDFWRRVLAWFDEHLSASPAGS